MKDYIQIGIEKGLISLNEDKSRIKYIWQKKERNYNDPEEKVQALAFLKLILDYYWLTRQSPWQGLTKTPTIFKRIVI